MAKKLSSKPQSLPKRAILLWSIGLLLVLVLSVQSAAIYYLWKQAEEQSIGKIQLLIAHAIQDMSRDPVIEPKEGRMYMPEARLSLPYDSEAPRMFYFADKTHANVTEAVEVRKLIVQVQNARTLEETFEVVPKLQACSRGVMLQYSDEGFEGVQPAFTKTLADGRKLNAYMEKGCPAKLDKLVERLKQTESY